MSPDFNSLGATELASDGSLLVLNRDAVWRDPKKFVANAGSLIGIRYVGGVTLAEWNQTLGDPGSPDKSMLVRRLKDTGFFRMPATQNHNEISPIVPVIEEWIRSLAPDSSKPKR